MLEYYCIVLVLCFDVFQSFVGVHCPGVLFSLQSSFAIVSFIRLQEMFCWIIKILLLMLFRTACYFQTFAFLCQFIGMLNLSGVFFAIGY